MEISAFRTEGGLGICVTLIPECSDLSDISVVTIKSTRDRNIK